MATNTIDVTKFKISPLVTKSEGKLPRVLTMAGSDSSGGAGIEADLKTISAHKCYGLTCINSLTAQNTKGVNDAYELPYDFLIKILDSNFSDIDIDVIKTGMLSENGIMALLATIDKYNFEGQLVLDPVIVSTSGFELSKQENLKLIIDKLFGRATLVTPNYVEAITILSLVDDEFESEEAAFQYYNNLKIKSYSQIIDLCRKIAAKSPIKNVLIKGGHVRYEDQELVDVLYESESDIATVFQSEFNDSSNTHGTGCTLASSIASNLSKGLNLVDSVGNGIIYVQNAIKTADNTIGTGAGPLCHFEVHEPLCFMEVGYHGEDLMEFLKNHPFVKNYWERYTHHPFIEKLARLELPIEAFYDYLKQDHVYLFFYAKTHALASAIAPNVDELQKEIRILENIIVEMKKHKEKLLKLGMTKSELDLVKMNQACTAYSDYLLKVARHGTWLEINIALSACLFGYREAAIHGNSLYQKTESSLKDTLYKEWLDDYCAEWYNKACIDGDQVIKNCKVEPQHLSQLLEIFGNVVKLEIKFWDAFL